MIIEYLDIALLCLSIFIINLIIYLFRSRSLKVFDGINFSKNSIHKLFYGNISIIRIKTILRFLGILSLIVSIAGIKAGVTVQPIERKGVDIIFCIDVSLSMDSQDVKPSRIDKVKFEMSKIVDSLEGDRLGIVVFSGSNFLYLPLTMDYDASKLFIRSIDTAMISSRGTNIPSAIKTSVEAFSSKDEQQKVIFLFSDGEDHSKNSIEVISSLIKDKIDLHVIGVGTSKGSLIPVKNKENVFIEDGEGKLVLSKINIEFLKNLSLINNGSLLRISKSEPVSENIIDIIKAGEDSLISSFEFSDYDYKYQYPLAISLMFLIISYVIPSGRKIK
jgi:Ca-activated chloride channel family protein